MANGPDAVRRLEESLYSLVIADIGLPNQGIEQLVARIARMAKAERPIVLVLAAAPEAARGLDVEIVQIVLRRPVDVNQIIDLVRSCVRNSSNGKRIGAGDEKGDGERGQLIS